MLCPEIAPIRYIDPVFRSPSEAESLILNGLGGEAFTAQHAENSERLVNATQPEFLATLVVSFPQGEARFRADYPEWSPLDEPGLFAEMERFLSGLRLERAVFRSDHVLNRLVFRGTLDADRERLLAQVRTAIERPDAVRLRPYRGRGL